MFAFAASLQLYKIINHYAHQIRMPFQYCDHALFNNMLTFARKQFHMIMNHDT